MWLQLGLAAGAVAIIAALFKRPWQRRARKIDVGPVSEAWLAEQRSRRSDHL